MKYKVESIGASFNAQQIEELSTILTQQSDEGWELHTVFSVDKRGCLGNSEGTTYLAVYRTLN